MANCVEEVGLENSSGLPADLCTVRPDADDVEFLLSRRQPLLESHATVAYIYLAVVCTALVVGTVGNVFILLVIGSMRNLHRTGKVFVVNLALADLCVAAIADPMCVLAVVKGEAWFDDKKWLCDTVASMCLTACFCAFLSLTLASINRFVFICHNAFYDKIFTTKTCVAACFLVWIAAFFLEFPNFVGWGGHFFDPKSHQCIWDRTSSLSYTLFVSVALIFCPLLVMLLCYVFIFRHIYNTKFNLYMFADTDELRMRMRKTWLETLRTSRMLLAIFLVFVVCWTPYGIVIVFDFYKKLSVEAHLFVTMLAHLHSAANCSIYTVTNRNFRAVVLRRLGCSRLCGRRRRGRDSSGTATTSESDTKSSHVAVITTYYPSSTVTAPPASAAAPAASAYTYTLSDNYGSDYSLGSAESAGSAVSVGSAGSAVFDDSDGTVLDSSSSQQLELPCVHF